MAKITKQNFVDCLEKSRILGADELVRWLAANDSDNVTEIAAKLVRDELLTAWQAKYLLSGRYRLDIGSYRLLERIERDELGDRFLAVHTQLGRKVNIQILPSDLAKNKERCESFIKKSSQTAKLDHPNLTHVYDIDQEGGRYFLVTEHVAGVTLDRTSSEQLADIDIARMVYRAAAGLQFAHEHGVEHGGLTPRDLIVGDNHSIKIQNLAVSPLRSRSNGTAKLNDFQTLAAIYGSILKEKKPTDSQDRKRLKKILAGMYSGESESIQTAQQDLADWLGDYENESFVMMEVNSGEWDFASIDLGKNDSAVDSDPQRLDNDSAAGDTTTYETESLGFLARMGRDHPVGLLAVGLVLGSLLLGGSWMIYKLTLQPNVNRVANQEDTPKENRSEPPMTKINTKQPANEENNGETQPAVVENEFSAQIRESMKKNTNSQKQEEARTQAGKPEPPVETKDNQESGNLRTVSSKPDENVKPVEVVAQPNIKPEQSEPVKKIVDPFENFPKTVSLPELTDLEERKLTNLKLPRRYLLSAELYAPPELISKFKKLYFSMKRSSDDKQKWNISVSKRETGNGTHIATLRKTESELLFQWQQEAESSRLGGYLQNCFLKLSIPTHNASCVLRKPLEFDSMIITEDKLSSEISSDLKYLPNLSAMTAEITTTNIPKTRTNPSIIDFKQGIPGRIILDAADRSEHPVLYLQVALDLRSKFEARSELALLTGSRPRPLKDMKEVAVVNEKLKMVAQRATQDAAAKNKIPAPKGLEEQYDKMKKKFTQQATLMTNQSKKFNTLLGHIPKVLNQPIDIRVFANYSGYQVDLIQTRNPAAEK